MEPLIKENTFMHSRISTYCVISRNGSEWFYRYQYDLHTYNISIIVILIWFLVF